MRINVAKLVIINPLCDHAPVLWECTWRTVNFYHRSLTLRLHFNLKLRQRGNRSILAQQLVDCLVANLFLYIAKYYIFI